MYVQRYSEWIRQLTLTFYYQYTNLPPLAGNRVLYSQQYGFYGGNLIFRGHFTATGKETAITTTVQYGFAGGYSAWLNGAFLGSSQGSPTVSMTTNTWTVPANNLRVGEDNVFVIIQGKLVYQLTFMYFIHPLA